MSTENALHIFLNDIYSAFLINNFIVTLCLDMRKKVFDTVDHVMLLRKSLHYGVQNSAYEWFCDYYRGRKQFVIINGVCSEQLEVNFGVPQGSNVGSILFKLYINDLVNSSSLLKFTIYADDTTLSFETDDLPKSNNFFNTELNKV